MLIYIKKVIKILVRVILNFYYGVKYNVSKKDEKLLIYTDSRGFLVNCFFCYKTPRYSYISKLSKKYNIDYRLCTETHTTLIDFLEFVRYKDLSKYSKVVLHLGIVDFSPRPLSQLDKVYKIKNKVSIKLFPQVEMIPNYYPDRYENEKTFSLYDFDYLTSAILPALTEISRQTKIIWLGMNHIDTGWDGNYPKKRPSNINVVLEYQKMIHSYLDNNDANIRYIDIDALEEFRLKTHTNDNIHLTKEGFDLVTKELLYELEKK